MKKKCVLILSGGQDSMTCLFWALDKGYEVHAVSFYYGQKHNVELVGAEGLCAKYAIPHQTVDIRFYSRMVQSALLDKTKDVNSIVNGLPASFVPNRNALFITLAHSIAQTIGAEAIIGGMCQTDYSGYPDCRWDFIQLIRNTLNAGSNSNIEIITPLMFLTKAQTFEMADKLGKLSEILERSHTCYNGNHAKFNEWGYGCGECPACKIREKGFVEYMQGKGALAD